MFSLDIAGADELAQRFADMPSAIREALTQKRDALAQQLLDAARAKLSGDVLNARSGALRDSLQASADDDLSARVFSSGEVKYAAAQEYGFEGDESVAAHSREIREAFGRAIDAKTIFVAAFARHMNLPARSYLRAALDEMRDDISQGFAEALEEGTQS